MSNPASIEAVGRSRGSDFTKHLLVMALLAIRLFPFYMMMQISVKDNRTFLANAWLPTAPGSWQLKNYIYAAKLILPYVANSVFVSVSATAGCLFIALLGAYFFAR